MLLSDFEMLDGVRRPVTGGYKRARSAEREIVIVEGILLPARF
jgi:hypothetical protein